MAKSRATWYKLQRLRPLSKFHYEINGHSIRILCGAAPPNAVALASADPIVAGGAARQGSCVLSHSYSQNDPEVHAVAGIASRAVHFDVGALECILVVVAQKIQHSDSEHQNYSALTDAMDAGSHKTLEVMLCATSLVQMPIDGGLAVVAVLGNDTLVRGVANQQHSIVVA